MNLLSHLYRRFAHLVRELAKFGSVGAIAFLITLVLSNALHSESGLGMGPLSSNAIATVVATTFAYVANRYWTFRHRDRTGLGREYVLFFALNGVGLVITQLFIGFTHYVLGLTGAIPYNASLIVGTGVATLFRFWSYKKWVFLPVEAPQVDPHSGLPEAAPQHPAAPGHPGAPAHPDAPRQQINGDALPSHELGRPIDGNPAEGYAEFTAHVHR
ncbi:GtrA family protein [Spirillospora sp. CA-255316]